MVYLFIKFVPSIYLVYTVKHANSITSIKQSPVLKGDIFLVLSYTISYEFNLF
jgi:hypothetical protein